MRFTLNRWKYSCDISGTMKSPKFPSASANAPWGMMSNCEAPCSNPPSKLIGSRITLKKHRVVIVRRAAEQPVLALRDLLDRGSHVPLYRGRVGVGGPHRDADRLAVHLQRIETVLPHEGLGVGELVVIERGVGPVAAALERRGHLPARGQGEANLGRSLELPLLVEK